jgi:hypothetical protein
MRDIQREAEFKSLSNDPRQKKERKGERIKNEKNIRN